jgi:hypothetical protein
MSTPAVLPVLEFSETDPTMGTHWAGIVPFAPPEGLATIPAVAHVPPWGYVLASVPKVDAATLLTRDRRS